MNQVEAWLAPQNAAEARRVVTPCAAPAFDHRLQVQPTRHTATWEYVSASPPDTAGLAAVRMLADSLRSQPPAGLFRDPARSQQENWVHVEELPDAQLRVAPEYPSDARKKGVEGTVMVQALVAKNGHVEDACIAKSIPDLDKAALRAVIHWEFKPAKSGGQPIAVWVAVPVKFSLR
jgi:TonB family protein